MGIGRLFRKREHADLDARLRADRPEPPEELLEDVVRRLETPRPVSSRRPARIAYSLAAVLTLALLVPLASFGALGSFQSNLTNAASSAVDVVTQAVTPSETSGTSPGSPPSGGGSDTFIASIGTYNPGEWICHWEDGTYTPSSAGTPSNWTPIQLTSQAIYDAHTGHTFDIGPDPGFTTPEACAAAAAANSPSVTITQAVGQTDPTNASPINFTVTFSQPVTDFSTGDVTLSGTAGATTATVTGSGPYNVAVSGMTSPGTVIITVAGGVAHNAAGYANFESTNTDNTVTYDATAPTVTIDSVSDSLLNASETSFTITWHANENGTYSVRVGGTSCTTGTVVASGAYTTQPNTVTNTINASSLAEGANTIRVCVTDAAANTGSATTTVTKDTTAPVITASCPTNGGSYTNNNNGGSSWNGACSTAFRVTVTAASSVTVSLQRNSTGLCWDGNSTPAFNATCPNPVLLTNTAGTAWSRALSHSGGNFPDGAYTATVNATDAAGNAATPLVISFTIT